VLFTARDLEGIRTRAVGLAFRRWRRPSVKPGTRLRTAIGVVEILEVAPIDVDAISADDARRAGAASLDALLAQLAARPDGDLYRIVLRYAGEDQRTVLRDSIPDDADLASIRARLARLDAASRHGPWTRAVLSLIAASDGVRAADLAARLGRETLPFKADVRKLKELGLTESLEVGYRLSPRGQAVLDSFSQKLSPSGNVVLY
jgi:hypothetical protein